MTQQEKIKAWCQKHSEDGYIYGATGWICSEARRKQQAAQYPAQADMILNVGGKWDGKQVWDCAQFTRYAAKEAGITLPSGATSQWNKGPWKTKGTIDELPLDEVCFLYRQADGKMQHTGVYQGDGTVYDDRGTRNGVMFTKLSDYKWTHYGVPNYDEGDEPMGKLYNAKVIAEKGNTVRMRKIPDATGAVLATVPVGTIVPVYEDADGWSHIEYNGTSGYMMGKFLERVSADEDSAANSGNNGDTGVGDNGNEQMAEMNAKLDRILYILGDIDPEQADADTEDRG